MDFTQLTSELDYLMLYDRFIEEDHFFRIFKEYADLTPLVSFIEKVVKGEKKNLKAPIKNLILHVLLKEYTSLSDDDLIKQIACRVDYMYFVRIYCKDDYVSLKDLTYFRKIIAKNVDVINGCIRLSLDLAKRYKLIDDKDIDYKEKTYNILSHLNPILSEQRVLIKANHLKSLLISQYIVPDIIIPDITISSPSLRILKYAKIISNITKDFEVPGLSVSENVNSLDEILEEETRSKDKGINVEEKDKSHYLVLDNGIILAGTLSYLRENHSSVVLDLMDIAKENGIDNRVLFKDRKLYNRKETKITDGIAINNVSIHSGIAIYYKNIMKILRLHYSNLKELEEQEIEKKEKKLKETRKRRY